MTPELLTRLPEILFHIGKVIGSDESLSDTLARISELVTELTVAEACSVMLADPERKLLLGRAAYGLERHDVSEVSFRFGEGVAGWVAERGESALIDDVAADARYKTLDDSSSRIRSLACVPLLNKGKVVGVLTVTSQVPRRFDHDSIVLLQLVANTIALDIENIRLQRLAVTDSLTGAFNREYLARQLPDALRDSLHRNQPLSMAMLDVDHFKSVNDTHGHDVGDKVLADIARRLRESSRERDMLIRYGGEEFLLLLPRTKLATAAEIADRMRVTLETTQIAVGALRLPIRISCGVAQHQTGESGDDFVKRADAALYAAKAKGRNRVELAEQQP